MPEPLPYPSILDANAPISLPDTLCFTSDGLIAAIAQQYDTGEVLMMAWMNAESLLQTLATGRVCYWSRSRQCFWRKGDISGHIQMLKQCRHDCDGDTLLLLVDQTGAACHEGTRSCFTRQMPQKISQQTDQQTDQNLAPKGDNTYTVIQRDTAYPLCYEAEDV